MCTGKSSLKVVGISRVSPRPKQMLKNTVLEIRLICPVRGANFCIATVLRFHAIFRGTRLLLNIALGVSMLSARLLTRRGAHLARLILACSSLSHSLGTGGEKRKMIAEYYLLNTSQGSWRG